MSGRAPSLARTPQRVAHFDRAAHLMSSFGEGRRRHTSAAPLAPAVRLQRPQRPQRPRWPATCCRANKGPLTRGVCNAQKTSDAGSGRVGRRPGPRSGSLNHQRVATARIYIPVEGLCSYCAGRRAPPAEAPRPAGRVGPCRIVGSSVDRKGIKGRRESRSSATAAQAGGARSRILCVGRRR
jgi:hypothetical protein